MRRRLVVLVLGLLAGVLVALAVPLAISFAAQRSGDLFVVQVADADRLATIAGTSLRTAATDPLRFELHRYAELFGTSAVVVDQEGSRVAAAGVAIDIAAPDVAAMIDRALVGQQAPRPHVAWPWDDRPYLVAVPASQDGQVFGAVLTLADTAQARDAISGWMLLLTGGALGVLLLAGLALGVPLVGWVLRPVARLAAVTQEISGGRMDARVVETGGAPELRRLAGAFNTMADSVERTFERQRFFVANASHQLRNPLTVLQLRLEMLEEYVSAGGRGEHQLALAELERLTDLLDGLLRLIVTEAEEAPRRDIDVATIVEDRRATWAPAFASAATSLHWTPPATPMIARLPAGILEQVIDGLLDNALKFAAGSPVELAVDLAGGRVMLAVTDSGPGLAADELAFAGERFWRSRRHQNVRGSGLGLAIIRELAAAGGGQLIVGRAPGGGLRVAVAFPVVSSSANGAAAPGNTSRVR